LMRELDLDESGDLDLSEIIAMKETFATQENKRATVTKVEVDAMKQNWKEKEDNIMRLYYNAKDDLKKLQEDFDTLKKRGGHGGSGLSGREAAMEARKSAKYLAKLKQAESR
jgi:hypothetical protein